MTTTRALRTAAVVLAHVFDPDEIPTDATGSVTVTLSRFDGTVVSTGAADGPDSAHQYTYPYAGSNTLDRLTVTWAATIGGDSVTLDQDRLEIVGGFMFGIGEARNADNAIRDVVKYPTATLTAKRIEVEDEAETICGQAFVPRYEQEYLNGTAAAALRLSWPLVRKVRRIAVAQITGDPYTEFTADQLARIGAPEDGVLRLDASLFWGASGWMWGTVWPPGVKNILVEYEHGHDTPPADIRRAGRMRLKSFALEANSALPDRAERIAVTDAGTVLLAIPTATTTGLPEVDAAYSRWPDPRPSFG